MKNAQSLVAYHPYERGRDEQVAESWWPLLEAWLDAVADSSETRRAYRGDVRGALLEIGARGPRELSPGAIGAYRALLIARRDREELAPATVARRISALRSFLRFAEAAARAGGRSVLPRDLLDQVLRVPRGERRRAYPVLDDQELAQLLAAAGTARDRALADLLASTALRCSEVVRLDREDLVRAGGGYVLQVHGKGGMLRPLPLPDDAARSVLAYLGRGPAGGPLLLDDTGHRRLRSDEARRLVHQLAGRVDVSPHALRHTAARRIYDHTRDIVAVQQILGHRRIETTRRYLEDLGIGALRRAMPPLPRLTPTVGAGPAPGRRRIVVRGK